MNVYEVIKAPLITEKGTKAEKARKYCFEVDSRAQKHEIRDAVEKIFNVKVEKVNTMVFAGKWKRVRYETGRTPDWKKAVVTLKEGHKISFAG